MRKYWYLLLFFFLLDIQLKAHLSFLFWLIPSWTGSWQSAPYVWTIHNPSEELHNRSRRPSLWRVGDYAVRPILVSVWRCEVMSDAVQLPANPSQPHHPTPPPPPPPPPHPATFPFTLPHPSGTCTVTDEENARRGGYAEGHCKVRLWYKSICNRCSLQVFL